MSGSEKPVGWGILGPGAIAARFADDLASSPRGVLVAVGSRSRERAEAFVEAVIARGGGRAGAGTTAVRAHGSYESLLADPAVEVVYVATPHALHAACALEALSAGKAVLVEKPFTVTRLEAEEVVALARRRRLFCMEAMWTRFLPHISALRQAVATGRLGEVRLVRAEFGEAMARTSGSRIFDPRLGGGALLDLGVYAVSFASMLLGAPEELEAVTTLDRSGVDLATVASARYRGGAVALLGCSVEVSLDNAALVAGTAGQVVLPRNFFAPGGLVITSGEGPAEEVTPEVSGSGLNYEADHVAECLRAGLSESPLLGLDATLEVMGTLDRIRSAAGIVLGR